MTKDFDLIAELRDEAGTSNSRRLRRSGMVPAIIAGLDVKQIHAGALSAIENLQGKENYKLAQFFRHQKTHDSLTSSVILTYSDALYYFGKWYLQLWAESLGKNKKGITAIHAVLSLIHI